MCKCCDDIQAWQENLNENKTNAKIFSTLVIYRWKEGEKKIEGKQKVKTTLYPYALKYCTVCGKKLL